ncbi:MAG: UTP--glucose-1-phosphate uridylyltransferase [Thermoplasmata archaeon]
MKVVIPAAGRGSRFLPLTKSMPKEMMPVLDRPIIQYVVEEAIDAGSDDITIIMGRGKAAVEEYFDDHPDLALHANLAGVKQLERIVERSTIHFVRQRQPLGLANALSYAEKHIVGEPFGVLLGDTFNICKPPMLKQLADAYDQVGRRGSVIAVRKVPADLTKRYGIVRAEPVGPRTWRVKGIVEKPPSSRAPSRLAVTGAYFLTPGVFDAIRKTRPGKGGEYQLADALEQLASVEELYAYEFKGEWFDVGEPTLWLRANIELALASKRFRQVVLECLNERHVSHLDRKHR